MIDRSISVVIPTYNSAALLPKAIDSVRSQNWQDLEIIVVDDGSVDETAETLAKLAFDGLRVIKQENAGPAAARNTGIAAARATWVAFLDADDFWLPGKLEAQMQALGKDAAARYCFADGIRLFKGRQTLQTPRLSQHQTFLDLLFGPQFAVGSVLVRRDCFEKIGLFATCLRTGEDWDMWLRVAAAYRGCYLPQPVLVFQVPDDPEKYSTQLLERCTLLVLDRLFSREETLRLWPSLFSRRRQVYAWHYAVLAKSHLAQRRVADFVRLAMSAVLTHPLGIAYLTRRWSRHGGWPRLRDSGQING